MVRQMVLVEQRTGLVYSSERNPYYVCDVEQFNPNFLDLASHCHYVFRGSCLQYEHPCSQGKLRDSTRLAIPLTAGALRLGYSSLEGLGQGTVESITSLKDSPPRRRGV